MKKPRFDPNFFITFEKRTFVLFFVPFPKERIQPITNGYEALVVPKKPLAVSWDKIKSIGNGFITVIKKAGRVY